MRIRSKRPTYFPRESGEYRLRYRHGEEKLATTPFLYTFSKSVEVTLPVRLHLEPPYLAGVVINRESGDPLSGVAVEACVLPRGASPPPWHGSLALHITDGAFRRGLFFPLLPSGRSVKTDAAGRFVLPLGVKEPSTAILWARSPQVWYHDSTDLRLWWSEEDVIDLDRHTAIDDVRLEVARGAVLEGKVEDESGNLFPGHAVIVYGGERVLRTQLTRADGSFRFERLPEGRYALECFGPATGIGMSTTAGIYDRAGLPAHNRFFNFRIELEDGERRTETIIYPRDALAVLEVEIPPAFPLADQVEYAMLIGGRPRTETPFGGSAMARDGLARLPGLFRGRYRVWVKNRTGEIRGAVAEGEVDVRRGEVVPVRPRLSSGVLTVRYAPPDAAPRIRDVERLLHEGEAGGEEWQRLGSLDVSHEIPGELRLEGLLPGLVRVRLEAPGYERVQTEPVVVGGEGGARTPVVKLRSSGAEGGGL